MKNAILKIAPTAVILAAGGFCAWPYFDQPAAAPPSADPAKKQEAPKGIEVPLTLLKPTLPPRPPRNPFIDHEALEAQVKASLIDGMKSVQKTILAAKKDTKFRTSAGKPKTESITPRTAEHDPLVGMILNATSAVNGQRVAMINEQTYKLGDKIKANEGEALLDLVEIEHHRVVLSQGDKRYELSFGTGNSIAANSGAARAASKAGRGATKGGKGAKSKKTEPDTFGT